VFGPKYLRKSFVSNLSKVACNQNIDFLPVFSLLLCWIQWIGIKRDQRVFNVYVSSQIFCCVKTSISNAKVSLLSRNTHLIGKGRQQLFFSVKYIVTYTWS